MTATAKNIGWHPFPGPAAINSRPYQNRSACMYHGFCNRGGCHVDAKNSTMVTTIPRAQETGHFKVVTRAHVTTIEVDGNGAVAGVNYLTDGVEYFQPAKVVLLASFTYENSRLLLLSKSQGLSGWLVEQSQAGRTSLFQPPSGRTGLGVVPVRSRQLVRLAGTGRRRGQLGRRQLRPFIARLHRRRQPVGDVGPPADCRGRHEHVRTRAGMGRSVEGVHQGERRPLDTARTSRRRRCRTRTTSSTSTRS